MSSKLLRGNKLPQEPCAPHRVLQLLLLTQSIHEPPDIFIMSSNKKIIPILKITIVS